MSPTRLFVAIGFAVAAAAAAGSARQLVGAQSATAPMLGGKPDLSGTWGTSGSPGSGVRNAGQTLDDKGSKSAFGGSRGGARGPARPGGPAGAGGPAAGARGGGQRGGGSAGGGGGVFTGGPPPNPNQDFPKYKLEFAAQVKDYNERQVELDPGLRCRPPGIPRVGPPTKIIQRPNEVVFLYEDLNGSFYRVIPIDRPHRTDADASYFGDGVGRWEGDTLVVETTNFNDDTWLTDNGAFHTADMTVIERFRRSGDTMSYQAIVEDPAVLSEPWQLRPRQLRLSAYEIQEAPPCVERDLSHVVDGTHHDNGR